MLGDTHWLGNLVAVKGSTNGSGSDPSGPGLHGVTHAALVNWTVEVSESVGGGLGVLDWVAMVGALWWRRVGWSCGGWLQTWDQERVD